MNTSAYIDSGILEEYVLGAVSPQEQQEVECLSEIYPEVRQELERLEKAMEQYALRHQLAVPAGVKEATFARLSFDGPAAGTAVAENEAQVPADSVEAEPGASETKVIRPVWGTWAVAASALLALLSAWALYEMAETRVQNERLLTEIDHLQEQTESLSQKSQYSATLADYYRHPDTKVIRMPGVDKHPNDKVVALWNKETREVVLDIQSLPETPTGKQYQLWCIVDGKPISMGMIDQVFTDKVLRMSASRPNVAAFAITLEREGGSPTPTMDDMHVMGKV